MWLDGPARFAADASLSSHHEGRMSEKSREDVLREAGLSPDERALVREALAKPFTNFKPAKGAAWLASKERKRDRKAEEEKTMQAVKRRDHYTCRYPECPHMRLEPRVEACHRDHRSMGGNPEGDRTTLETLICFCFLHHSEWDKGVTFDVEPQTANGFSGPCDFTRPNPITGKWEVFARETVRGFSVAVGE
jgi:hypothetical protein